MGDTANHEQPIVQWTDLVNERSPQDLPYKIELTAALRRPTTAALLPSEERERKPTR